MGVTLWPARLGGGARGPWSSDPGREPSSEPSSEPISREPRGPRGGPCPKSNEGGRSADAGVVVGVPGGGVSLGVSRELRIDSTGVCEVAGVKLAGVTAEGVTFLVTMLEPKSEPCREVSTAQQNQAQKYRYDSRQGEDLRISSW